MSDFLFCIAKPFLHALDPEDAHKATILSLKTGLMPSQRRVNDPRLHITLWNRTFENPVGIAAGFDKNAEVIGPMFQMGAAFAEVGTVTPKPQAGNPRPRLFRNPKTDSIINRMGFPNQGLETFKKNVEHFLARHHRPKGLVGINIGMNKDQTNPAEDYCLLLRELAPLADYFTINISSPNTPGLRDLQTRENFLDLTGKILEQRKASCEGGDLPPILVKLAPDLDEAQQEELAKAALESGIDGLVLTNTTLARPEILPKDFGQEKGGLSGKSLTQSSTEIIRNFYRLTDGKLPIMGVGGISSAQDAYDKIRAGASVVQLYSALVFQGPELIQKINTSLLEFLERDGFTTLSEAIGADHKQKAAA